MPLVPLPTRCTKPGIFIDTLDRSIHISLRTFQRWVRDGDDAVSADSRTTIARPEPANKLSDDERGQILAVANSEEFASLPPISLVGELSPECASRYACGKRDNRGGYKGIEAAVVNR